MARVQVINRANLGDAKNYHVELQWCRYFYDDGKMEHGYRYIWVDPEGRLLPQRGQARLPSLRVADDLMKKVTAEGWGDYNADHLDAATAMPLESAEPRRPGLLRGSVIPDSLFDPLPDDEQALWG